MGTRLIVGAAGGGICALAVAVLIGWQIHSRSLIQVIPTLAPMYRMTAVSFLLSGIALLFLNAGRKRAVVICASITLLLVMLVCLEYATGADFGIDQLLGFDYITVHNLNPGRMSPVTALSFIGASLALLAAASSKLEVSASAVVGILASILTSVGTVSALGSLFTHSQAYDWILTREMALHSSAGFVVLGIGLLAWAWHESQERPEAPEWLPLSIGLGLAAAAFGIWRTLVVHEASELPLISGIILASGLLGASLVAIAISQAQQAQRHSREMQEGKLLLERLFEASPDTLLLTDQHGRILQVNQRIVATLGYTRDELLGQPLEILVPEKDQGIHQTHRENYYAQLTTRPMGQGMELRARRKNGSEFPVEIALSPVRTGSERLVLAVLRDITERKKAEEALRLSEERFRGVFEQGPMGVAIMGIDGRMLKVNAAFCQMLGYSEAELTKMTPFDITHPEDREASVNLMEFLFHRDVPAGRMEKRYIRKNGEMIWGSLSVSVIRDQQDKPLYTVGLVADITERKRGEAAVRESETAFVTLANCVPQMVWMCTPDGMNVYFNRRWVEYTGLTLEESYGRGWNTPFHPDDKQAAWDAWNQATATGGPYRVESRLRAADGSYRWFLMRGVPLCDASGSIVKWFGTCTDIDDLKRTEQKLQESEARLQLQINRTPIGCMMFDKEFRILSWNPAAERIFGFSAQEVLGLHAYDCIVPRDLQPEVDSVFEQLIKGSETAHSTNENLTKDGRRITCEWTNTPLKGSDGAVHGILCMAQDITERTKAEEALRQSEERFRGVFETSPLGLALIRLDYRLAKVNPALCRISGFSEAELLTMNPLDFTYPEDWEESRRMSERLFKGEIPFYQIEKRYLKKSGEIMWTTMTAAILRDREGRPLYGVGMIEDITERKRAEAELRLDSEIFATMEEGVCLVRLDDGIIVHTNPKFEKMFGYDTNELVGKHISLVNAPADKHPEEAAEVIRKEVTRSGVWRGEVLHRRKDGTPFWSAVTVSTFQHPEFGTVGVSIHQDVTDLKKARETLRESEERFRGMFEQGPIGVALLGPDHRMNKVNPALCRMLGYSEAELANMTPLDMTYPDDREMCTKELQALDNEEITVCKIEKRYVKKNGEIMWVSLTASVIRDNEGRPLHGLGLVEDITEHRYADEKLAEQAALLDLAHDAIIVFDLDGRITFWNRGAEDTYGWPVQEALGRVTHDLLQTRFPIPLKEIEAAILRQGRWEGELEHTTRDGRGLVLASRWSLRLDDHGKPGGILEINRDITERKRADEELRSLTERLSLAIRSASIGVWDWDLRTNTTVWDDTIFEMFGIAKVVPMAYEEFSRRVHPDDLPKVEASLQRAIEGKTQDFVEFRIIRPDRSIRHIYTAQGVVKDERGKVVRLVGTALDITERKDMEAQIEANKVQLVAAARLSALGMMAGGVAHEINNPLGIIHALASDLRDMVKEEGSVPPELVARNSARIRETADRIARIVKSLRQISREGSRDKLRPARVGKVMEATLAICRERFKANAVKLLLPQAIPELSVPCREVQIEQILLNLLQNAFDAVAEQPGEKWVRLNIQSTEESVIFSVTDNGPGISEELQTHIMEPFFTTKPIGKGTGLGLSLSKSIAEEHGGKLEYSEDHGHTCFSLVLPLAREAEAAWT
jgi:PAS domain S-box-containing protein